MRDCSKYGNYYWCIKVPKEICKDNEIYVHANEMLVSPNGDLLCIGKNEYPILALSRGNWIVFFAASLIDGAAVAVQHWTGEVI